MEYERKVRAIAFFLPQFHPIPENDEWWGKGFTEWRNVAGARPLFPGHEQPHIPADLGFYDLRLPETRKAQADLAREYGISGFCYYHYWFHGRQLLERPFAEVVALGEPDLPFCLCWANENWTRRWDGGEDQILIAQSYSVEDDLEHIRNLIPVFKDERYIKINGKPLFLIYRVDLIPDPRATAALWRSEVRRAGLPGLYVCDVVSSGVGDPDPGHYGLDAAVEFQPDWRDLPSVIKEPRNSFFRRLLIRRCIRLLSIVRPANTLPALPENLYSIHGIRSYRDLVERMMRRPEPPYKVFPCVAPRWDNSARRKRGAYIFVDATPELYGAWLKDVIKRAAHRLPPGERFVFVNAWNEWAEGNYLEPDMRWGHSYLRATKDALLTG
jgi:lipopolysaccharide biosynthesis protein